MRAQRINTEVCVADENIVKVRRTDVTSLKEILPATPRGRTRLCAHKDATDALHEMMIVLRRGVYIRPHKHLGKSESFHLVEGLVDVVVFAEDGTILEVIQMGDYSSGRVFYYRFSEPCYHTLLIRSDLLVVHETTSGPFRREDTVFAAWSPEEGSESVGREFMKRISQDVELFLSKNRAGGDE